MTKKIWGGVIVAFVAGVGIVSGAVIAAQEKKTDDNANIAGTWNLSLAGHQVGLVLEQEGAKLTGTLMMMGRDVPVEGEFVGRAMTLTGVGKVEAHGPEGSVALKLTGTLKEDGTMAGEFATAKGPLAWTAERLRTRKK